MVSEISDFFQELHATTSCDITSYKINVEKVIVIFHCSSPISHDCSCKIKLIIYNSVYKKQYEMFKFVDLKLLQEFCQTYISLTCLSNCSSTNFLDIFHISCLILLGSSYFLCFFYECWLIHVLVFHEGYWQVFSRCWWFL